MAVVCVSVISTDVANKMLNVCVLGFLPTTLVVQVEQLVRCVCPSVCPDNNFSMK